MRRETLTELAANPEFISGIYNYCDRWCERCPFSSKCLLYAQEKEDEDDSPESRDLNNEAFWRKLAAIFEETRLMIEEWAKEAGVDLIEVDDEEFNARQKRRDRAWRNGVAVAGKEYASSVTEWFKEFDQTIAVSDLPETDSDSEQAAQLQEAREVIYWYQYQIAVKTMRALSSREDELEEGEYVAEVARRDSDGSAKVALIGIDRSISAWRIVQLCVPERAELVVPLILQLEKLRSRTEKQFPDARSFIRPGFDEVLGEAN
jgi:hypothetical protein